MNYHDTECISSKLITKYFYSLDCPVWNHIKFINDNIIKLEDLISLYTNTLEQRLIMNAKVKNVSLEIPFNAFSYEDKKYIVNVLDDILSDKQAFLPMFNSYMHYHYDLVFIFIDKFELSSNFKFVNVDFKYYDGYKFKSKGEPTEFNTIMNELDKIAELNSN